MERLLADGCWEIEIWFRFCLDLVIWRLFGVDLVDLGRFLAIGASFPGWCGGRLGGGDGWRLFCFPACLISSRFCFDLGFYVLFCLCLLIWAALFWVQLLLVCHFVVFNEILIFDQKKEENIDVNKLE